MTIWANLYTETNHNYPEWWLVYGDSYGTLNDPSKAVKGVKGSWDDYVATNTESGNLGRSFGYDFLNRIHITPQYFNFGNLIGTQTYSLKVWSSHYYGRNLEGISLTNAEGVALSGGVTPPYTFAPLQQVTWTIEAGQFGPPVIDGTLSLDFDKGELFDVPLYGKRVILWSWFADWKTPVIERLEWATDVLRSYDGSEQRRRLRMFPRRTIEFDIMEHSRDRRILESLMWSWGARVWAIPIWTDGQLLPSDVSAGDTSIPCITATRDFEVGSFVVLSNGDPDLSDIGEVAAISSNSLTVLRPLVNSWGAGTRVYPARPAYLKESQALTRKTGDAVVGKVTVDFIDPQNWTADAGTQTHRGYPVVTLKHNWASDPGVSFERSLFTFDNGTGVPYRDDETGAAIPTVSVKYSMLDRASIDQWRKLLHALKGRFASVWIRSYAKDFRMMAPILSAALVLTVERLSYTAHPNLAVSRRDVRIELFNGSVFYRRLVLAEVLSPELENITLDTPLGVDLQVADVKLISYIMLVRLNTDVVELAWHTTSVAECAVTFKGFKNDV